MTLERRRKASVAQARAAMLTCVILDAGIVAGPPRVARVGS